MTTWTRRSDETTNWDEDGDRSWDKDISQMIAAGRTIAEYDEAFGVMISEMVDASASATAWTLRTPDTTTWS